MEEKPRKRKPRKKFPVKLPSYPPIYENGGRLFSRVRKHRKQARPTLVGTGALIYGPGSTLVNAPLTCIYGGG